MTWRGDFAANYSAHGGVFAVLLSAPFVIWLLCRIVVASAEPIGTRRPTARARPSDRPAGRWAIVLVAAVACLYGLLMAHGEDLVGPDYAQLTAKPFAEVPIWPASGRFFPLAFQEYNLLNLINKSAMVYYAFATIELVVLLVVVWRLLDAASFGVRAAALACLLTLPGIATVFQGLVYPERDMLCWLVVWILFRQLARVDGSGRLALATLISAQCLLYLKETAFLIVGGFAGARLAIRWLRSRRAGEEKLSTFLQANLIDVGQLALCGVFLLTYAFVILPHVEASYAVNSGARHAALNAAKGFLTADPILAAMAVALFVRVAVAIARDRPLDDFWDALAFGALAFVLAYAKLGMYRDYYAAPADLVGVLYLARLVPRPIRVARPVLLLASLGFVAGVLSNARVVVAQLRARKVFVERNARLLALVKESLSPGVPIRLFFPQVGGFQIMEFAAYLQYKGIAVQGGGGHPSVIFATPHRFPGDRCFPSQAFRCEYAPNAAAGDYVVYLPGHLEGSMSRLRPELRVAQRY